jgi:hypothetical protein
VLPKFVDWYVERKFAVDELISHRVTLDEIAQRFDMLTAGHARRVVIDLDASGGRRAGQCNRGHSASRFAKARYRFTYPRSMRFLACCRATSLVSGVKPNPPTSRCMNAIRAVMAIAS